MSAQGAAEFEGAGLGDAGQQGDEDDGEQVLDDEDAVDDLGVFLPGLAHVRQGLDGDGGGGDGQDGPQEQAVHGAPAEPASRRVADADQHGDFQQGGQHRGAAHLLELAQAELQPQGEEEEDDAQFGQGADGLLVLDEGHGAEMGADEQARQDVADHHRLAQAVADHRHQAGGQHHHGEVVEEGDGMIQG